MKLRGAWIQELRGSIGGSRDRNRISYQTLPDGSIRMMKCPNAPRPATGKQGLYRHQLHFLSRKYNVMSDADKKTLRETAQEHKTTPWAYYVKQEYPENCLWLLCNQNAYVIEHLPNRVPSHVEDFFFANWIGHEERALVGFPLHYLLPMKNDYSKVELWYWLWSVGGELQEYWIDQHRVTEDWDENRATWNNQPSFDPTPTDSDYGGNVPDEWHKYDVTSDVDDYIENNKPLYGWLTKYRTTVGELPNETSWMSYLNSWLTTWPVLKVIL